MYSSIKELEAIPWKESSINLNGEINCRPVSALEVAGNLRICSYVDFDKKFNEIYPICDNMGSMHGFDFKSYANLKLLEN